MTNCFEDRKSLLLVSGGLNSSLHALSLSVQYVQFDCLHFREAHSEGSKAFKRAQEDASMWGSKLHVIDTTPLRDFFDANSDQPLLGCSYLDEGADPTSRILMLSLAAKFARNHGYKIIYMGVPSGSEREVEHFMEAWERLLWAFEPSDPQYGYYVNPQLRFVTFPPDDIAPSHAVVDAAQAA